MSYVKWKSRGSDRSFQGDRKSHCHKLAGLGAGVVINYNGSRERAEEVKKAVSYTHLCLTMVWSNMILGIVIGIVGIVLLLCLIPLTKGFK